MAKCGKDLSAGVLPLREAWATPLPGSFGTTYIMSASTLRGGAIRAVALLLSAVP